MNKKGQMDSIIKLATGFAVITIVLVVTFLILAEGKSQGGTIEGLNYSDATVCATSHLCNTTGELSSAVASIPGWLPLVVIVTIGAALIGLLALFKMSRNY